MKFINLTPHVIRLNDGREFPPSEVPARVDSKHSPFNEDGLCRVEFGKIYGLPEPEEGVCYIVSGMVATAARTYRSDVVSPATGHPDCVRKDGQVWSVPGFVRVW